MNTCLMGYSELYRRIDTDSAITLYIKVTKETAFGFKMAGTS